MKAANISFLALTALLVINLVSCASTAGGYEIRVKKKIFKVDLAITPEQQSLGLGGRSSLSDDGGMLFIYDKAGSDRIFWMKGMSMVIDIIWINTGRIVHIEHSVKPPDDDTPLNKYPRYGQGIVADAVLELAEGVAKENDLKIGDPVDY